MSITTIEWTHRPGTVPETLNPTTGCNKVNRGCKFCYAEVMHRRLMKMQPEKYNRPFLDGAYPYPAALEIPYRWKKSRTVFVDSMSDLFHKNIPFEFILQCFDIFNNTSQHTYLILTKRPERAVEFQLWMKKMGHAYYDQRGEPTPCPPNVWMGTSCNDQKSAQEMIPYLLELDCSIRFLSYEPATGPVNLRWINADPDGHGHPKFCMINALTGDHTDMGRPCPDVKKLDWVIAGGESGHGSEPAHPEWFRQVRDDCKATGTPFFFKQFGNWHPVETPPELPFTNDVKKNYHRFTEPCEQWMHRTQDKGFNLLDGQLHQEFPA